MEIRTGNGGPPSEAEGAAIAAALERFLADTTPVAPPTGPQKMDPWLRQALIDGVSAKEEFGPGEPPGFG
ncbi:MAG: hypothetical protein ACKOL0_05240 [Solirubrobacterales bacterium]